MKELISIAVLIATLFGGTLAAEKIYCSVREAALTMASNLTTQGGARRNNLERKAHSKMGAGAVFNRDFILLFQRRLYSRYKNAWETNGNLRKNLNFGPGHGPRISGKVSAVILRGILIWLRS